MFWGILTNKNQKARKHIFLFIDKNQYGGIYISMNKSFKKFLMDLIKKGTISVFHDEAGSDYIIPGQNSIALIADMRTPDEITELKCDDDFTVSCEFFTQSAIPYGSYKLEYGDEVLLSAIAPLFVQPKDKTARDLISLAKACSKKIVVQQKMAQQRNMILGMAQDNQYLS